jgi:hypothetical protein
LRVQLCVQLCAWSCACNNYRVQLCARNSFVHFCAAELFGS